MVQITRRDVLTGAAASGLVIPAAATARSTDAIKMAVGATQVGPSMRLSQGIDNRAITNVHDLLARAPNGDFAKTSADFMPELATV